MKMMKSQRGFALVAVLSILALLVVYLVTVEGANFNTHLQHKRMTEQQERAQLTAALIEKAMRGGDGSTSVTLGLANLGGEASRRPLAADDPVWAQAPGLAALPGDVLITVRWKNGPVAQSYLANTQGERQGVVRLGTVEIQ